MIKLEMARKIFKNKYKDLEIKEMYDLPPKYYLFLALKMGEKRDINDPYYAVDKNSGKVYNYIPIADLENFSRKKEVKM